MQNDSNTIRQNHHDITNLSIDDLLSTLNVDKAAGLSANRVEILRKVHGFNEVAERKQNQWLKFLKKFWGLSAWMLEAILILSIFLRKYSDVLIVSALLIVNAVISFLQEKRAAGVVESLKQRLQVNARVLREGQWQIVQSRELVPGDILRLRHGDIIPADIKLLDGFVSVDQSALTGESIAVSKAAGEMLFSGSILRQGEATGVVVLTGSRTYFGHTTELVQKASPKLHIETIITQIVKKLFIIVGVLLVVLIVINLLKDESIIEMLPLLLVLLMGAVPVALPVMFTVSTALGAKDLAKHGVLVTRLSAVEDAATMDTLCVDKTGTVTLNHLSIAEIFPLGGNNEADVLLTAMYASQESNQDPIDLAVLSAAREKGLEDSEIAPKLVKFSPFNASNRRTEAIIEQSEEQKRIIKGAVSTVLLECDLETAEIAQLETVVNNAAKKGYRTLAVASGNLSEKLNLIGLLILFDPPRPDAKPLIKQLKNLGISVKLLTGDGLAVAREIAQSVGLLHISPLAEFKELIASSNHSIDDVLKHTDGFAEIYPEDKYTIVQSLQEAGHIVGMTGDGVNDAPALRQAEVGIAVSSATDVAKGAASIVLTDPGLIDIVTLIKQGRAIYQRILTWVLNKISRTILKTCYITFAYLITGKFVMSAFAMLAMVLMTDFAKISLATDNVRPSEKPESWHIDGYLKTSVVLGLAMVAEALAFLVFAWTQFDLAADNKALYTFSFLLLLYFAAFSILSVRERNWFWKSKPSVTLLLGVGIELIVGTTLSRLNFPDFTQLPWWQIFSILGFAAFSCLVVNEGLKMLMLKRSNKVQEEGLQGQTIA